MKKQCWPNCVLLMSFCLDHDNHSSKVTFQNLENINIKLMVSNDQLEIPANQQLSFTVGAHEQKEMVVDLKYAKDKEEIIFYASSTIGDCSLKLGVNSEAQPSCLTDDDETEFEIDWGETAVPMQAIKDKLKEKEMQDDNNIELCLVVSSESTCKGTI